MIITDKGGLVSGYIKKKKGTEKEKERKKKELCPMRRYRFYTTPTSTHIHARARAYIYFAAFRFTFARLAICPRFHDCNIYLILFQPLSIAKVYASYLILLKISLFDSSRFLDVSFSLSPFSFFSFVAKCPAIGRFG